VIRILIVEDAIQIGERLVEIVKAAAIQARAGELEISGPHATEDEALAAIARAPTDVALIDLQLAQGTGFGVIRGLGARTTSIVFTNHAVPALKVAAFEAGAGFFLDKSRDWNRLERLILEELVARTEGVTQ
jgi:DNA-binding response OmpR family regulator